MFEMISLFFFFKFTKAQNVIYSGERSTCIWEKSGIYCFWMKCPVDRYQLGPTGPVYYLKLVFPY